MYLQAPARAEYEGKDGIVLSKIDTKSLHLAVYNFEHYATPKSPDKDRPCTARELQIAVKRASEMMRIFIAELENME